MKNKSHQIPEQKFWHLPQLTLKGAACILLCGSVVQSAKFDFRVYPNGNSLFQSTNAAFFHRQLSCGRHERHRTVYCHQFVYLVKPQKTTDRCKRFEHHRSVDGLSVSAALNSNTLHSRAIEIKDANGSVAESQTVTFDMYQLKSDPGGGKDQKYQHRHEQTPVSVACSISITRKPMLTMQHWLRLTNHVDSHNNNGGGSYWSELAQL